MLIIPAIDLQDGCVVRFVQGKFDKKVYSKDPVKTAKHWAKLGAKLLHVVDLDGAFSGIPKNIEIVGEIVKNVNIPVEFGGGVRSVATIKKLLEYGVWRVVLGTKAASDKIFLKKAASMFKEKIIVSIDAKAGQVMIEGWNKAHKNQDAVTFAQSLKETGFKRLIYTDTAKDGTLSGPNIQGTKELLKKNRLKLIASGGISSLEDLKKLKQLETLGLEGVIIGKALYEGRFTLAQALRI